MGICSLVIRHMKAQMNIPNDKLSSKAGERRLKICHLSFAAQNKTLFVRAAETQDEDVSSTRYLVTGTRTLEMTARLKARGNEESSGHSPHESFSLRSVSAPIAYVLPCFYTFMKHYRSGQTSKRPRRSHSAQLDHQFRA